ncbi:MAG TPA: methionine--tRNA ligase [Patescibacteria group bacterium]|nr:methionine--tRNA ligase [Patescibacteria group bacterium]
MLQRNNFSSDKNSLRCYNEAVPKFYITTAIPYVNAKPHVGHALEFIQADVIARYHRVMGDEVILLSGGDENALKNVQAAEKAGVPVQQFVDTNSMLFAELAKSLNVQFDVFQRGSSQEHHIASQKLWELCSKNGDIYKKIYTGLYCVGCELFYEKDELDENGQCYEHPGKKLEEVSEENYFFRLSKYQNQLLSLLEKDELVIIPQTRKNEALSFLKKNTLQDISISRSNKRAKNWGVPVPGDEDQRMYVWFDALNIYQSGVGFGSDEAHYRKWWPADVHVIGKGILRFHAIYWPAFLLSAHLPIPKSLFVHGYFTVNGQKMSKTIGNVIDPLDIIKVYGVDGFRYYVLSDIPPTGDGDFSESRLKEVYNADLANGLGNLVARVAKLCESAHFVEMSANSTTSEHVMDVAEYTTALNEYRFNDCLKFVFGKVKDLNHFIDTEKPWDLLKVQDRRINGVLNHCVDALQEIAVLLQPFLPETSEKILEQFKGPEIKADKPLFPRL